MTLVVSDNKPETASDLSLLSLAPPAVRGGQTATANGGLQTLIQTGSVEANGEVSPDGRWLAYQSNESGPFEVYVRPFPDSASRRWLVSTNGGRAPVWARSGRELFYLSTEGAVMGVRVETGSTWQNGLPTVVLPPRYFVMGGASARTFDVAPDGRFLMIKEGGEDQTRPPSIVIVTNWFEELKAKLPAR
jgi:serine/threonine-protein kinase